jgi:hypothetical protein
MSILSLILRYDGENLCSSSLSHIGDGQIPPDMMAKAVRLLSHAGNYSRVFQGRGSRKRLVAILFNSKRHIVGGNGIVGSAVDASRAKRFLSCLDGVIARTVTVTELVFEVLSLHRVTVKAEDRIEPYVLMPVWSMDDMQQVHRPLSCICGGFVRSGWV